MRNLIGIAGLKREEIERSSRLLERRDVLEMLAARIEALEAQKRG